LPVSALRSRESAPRMDSTRPLRIGVLAMQGAFEEHVDACAALGADACQVKLPTQFEGLDALIIPGGESTTMQRIADRWGMVEPLRQWVAAGKPIWGTCAGLILLSKSALKEEDYVHPEQRCAEADKSDGLVGGLDVVVHRNFFGSQVRSFEKSVTGPPRTDGAEPLAYNGIFIRAPAVVEVGPKVTVLSSLSAPVLSSLGAAFAGEDGVAVAVQQENILGTSFHPELSSDRSWHVHFLNMVSEYLNFGAPFVEIKAPGI